MIEGETPGLIIEFLGDTSKLSSVTASDAWQNLNISCSDWQEIMGICSGEASPTFGHAMQIFLCS